MCRLETLLCLSPGVAGEVYCFPRYQLIFSFGRRVIYHSKGLWEYIPKSIPFVCTTIFKQIFFKRIAKRELNIDQIAMCYIYQWIHLNKLYKLMKFFFFQISFIFRNFCRKPKILVENQKVFKRIERRECWSNCNVLCINGFVSTSFTNCWNLFSKFQISFRNFGRKPKNIQTNREAWILVKVKCSYYI